MPLLPAFFSTRNVACFSQISCNLSIKPQRHLFLEAAEGNFLGSIKLISEKKEHTQDQTITSGESGIDEARHAVSLLQSLAQRPQ